LKKKQTEVEKFPNKGLLEKVVSVKSSYNKDYIDEMSKLKESFKKLEEENVKLKANSEHLQVTIDAKNDVISELQLEAKNDKQKLDHLAKSFSKSYLLNECFYIN
jgi:regulator of replication initiation timing